MREGGDKCLSVAHRLGRQALAGVFCRSLREVGTGAREGGEGIAQDAMGAEVDPQ